MTRAHVVLCAVAIASAAAACGDPDDPGPDPTDARCEGGLAPIDGECVLLEHALELLVFRTTNAPYVSVCRNRIISDDPGIEPGVVAERDGCRVIDIDMYGPSNMQPAARESGVEVQRGEITARVDEAELFESCMERSTLDETFFAYDGAVTARFGGNDLIPAFNSSVQIPPDPQFRRSAIADGEPIRFTWTPVDGDSLSIVVAEFPIQIVCTAPISAGAFSVPADLVEMLPESDPPGLEPITSIRVRNQSILAFEDDNAIVTLGAEAYQSAF